jgi:hypothetical protein
MVESKRRPGRPKGAKNKRTVELLQEAEKAAAAIGAIVPGVFSGDAHSLLMAIYKNPTHKIELRLDAAKAAAPYEKPKLASTELKSDAENPLKHKLVIEFVRAPEKPIPE